MNLFERLLHRRLCNEQPADGGTAPAPSEPPAPAADPAKPEGDKPQHGAEGDKPQDDKPADGDKPADKPDDKEQKPEGAPEKYEFKPAEGQELDTAALEQFEPIARELNLTNEQAQKMVDLYGTKIMPMVQKQQAEAWQAQTEEWAATVKADKEIGGDKLTANLGVAQRALDTFGTPALKEYLNGTGLGNHPELVKAFVKVGKAMSEDGVVTGKESGQRSAAEVLYGK
ncbi:TPA: peptidase [Klebsiella pneumoniae]|uniref:peptidase n=1 Tax=Klebsiella pneumoniae complex TaxID=3390273 RepID=UPI0007CC161F|nr:MULTISPECIES: peptidase [Klebsiella]MBC4424306.1 peptidase [Klebsiella variicola]MCD9720967.1 peptidase [Klebsiella pneumoniae]MDT9789526.1 peptidase [Klebsiella pneumoniae]MDY9940395.1 peptidase [Klebsiella pneumoniae]MDZ0187307.1 peptidase [Klebsiella pneumoniae]